MKQLHAIKKWLFFKKRIPAKPMWHTFIFWTLLPLVLGIIPVLFHRFFCVGRGRVPARGSFVLLCNHQSHYDVLLCALAMLDRPFRAIGRKNLFAIPFLGWLLAQLGGIPLKRGSVDRAALNSAVQTLEKGRPLLIYPEGTRSNDGTLGKFASGFLMILKRSPSAVLPMAVEGAGDAWPPGKTPTFHGRMAVAIGRPIDPDILLEMSPEEANEFVRKRIERLRCALRRLLRARSKGKWPSGGPSDYAYWVTR